MGIFPVSVVRWQTSPRRTRSQDPKNCIEKISIITGSNASGSVSPWKVRLQKFPNLIRHIVSTMSSFHNYLLLEKNSRKLQKVKRNDDTM